MVVQDFFYQQHGSWWLSHKDDGIATSQNIEICMYIPIHSMYGLFIYIVYICLICMVNVGDIPYIYHMPYIEYIFIYHAPALSKGC